MSTASPRRSVVAFLSFLAAATFSHAGAAAPPLGETHGSIYAEVADVTGKERPLVRVNLPDVRVSAQNVATNEMGPSVKTDLDGAYRMPALPAGTYRLCWAAQGFTRGCRNDNFTPSDQTTYIEPTPITPQHNMVFGRVKFKDNTSCRFVAPTFGVNLNAKVAVAGPSGFHREVNANSAGYYLIGGLPFDRLELTGKCEKATATRATESHFAAVGVMPMRYDLVLPNQALSTLTYVTQPGAVVRASAATGSMVDLQSETLGSHPYPLQYRWQEELPQPGFASPNAPALAWKVPDAPRATMHVLAGDGFGAYSYKAVTLSTDTKHIVFEGRVIDEDKQPVDAAAVAINGVKAMTKSDGRFAMTLPEETPQYVVNIDKVGFKFFSRNLKAPATGVSYQIFRAFEIAETQAPTFNAAEKFRIVEKRDPKMVRLAGDKAEGPGVEIEFESEAIAEAAGDSEKPVSGPIQVHVGTYAMHDSADQLPGDLTGIGRDKKPVRLSSFGSASVSLHDMGGKPLRIARGKSAMIRLPIDGALLAAAPPTLKLWSFDERLGVWTEEGVATKKGNAYEGRVTHFSAVNMDINSTTGACTRIHVDNTVFPDFLLHITSTVATLPNGHQDQLISDPSGLSVVGREPPNTQFTFEMYKTDGSGALYPNGASRRVIMTGPPSTLGNKYPIVAADYPYSDCTSDFFYDAGFLEVINSALHGPFDSGSPFLTYNTPPVYLPVDDPSTQAALAKTAEYYGKIDPNNRYTTGHPSDFTNWKQDNNFTGPQPNDGTARAAYFNFYDLGFGRDMHMKDNSSASCVGCVAFYVTNYASQANAASQTAPLATVAMEFSKHGATGGTGGTGAPYTKFFVFGADGSSLKSVALDHNAPKFVPALCVVCHNGAMGASSTGDADGNLNARFIPFDAESFYPPGTASNPYPDEAAFRAMNTAVRATNPGLAASALIDSVWYNNSAGPSPHSNFFAGGVPTGWHNQLGPSAPVSSDDLYSGVVKLYCRSCHAMRDGTRAFDNLGNFNSSGPRAAACLGSGNDFMPQSELNFRRFWLHSTLQQGPNLLSIADDEGPPQTCQ